MGHIYIGYSRKDREVVRQYIDRLRAEGREVWVDIEDIPAGAEWRTETQQAIAEADAYILFLSLASVESQWIRTELNSALKNNKPIIPVLLEHVPLELVPLQIANIQYVDATQGIETAQRQISLALEATVSVTPRQQARQTAQMPAVTVAPAQARAKSGVNWAVILAVVGVLVTLIILVIFTAPNPDLTATPTKITPATDDMVVTTSAQMNTAIAQALTETAAIMVTNTSTVTGTSTPSPTPHPQKRPAEHQT